MNKISKFELIDWENGKGRVKIIYGKLEYDLQDNKRTLKVFIHKTKGNNE